MLKLRFLMLVPLAGLIAMPAAGGPLVDALKAQCGDDKVANLLAGWTPVPSASTGEWEVIGSAESTEFERGAYRAYREFEGAALVEELVLGENEKADVTSLTGIDRESSKHVTLWSDADGCRVIDGTFSLSADGASGSRRMGDVSLDYKRVGAQKPETPGVDCTANGKNYTVGSSGPCCGGKVPDAYGKCGVDPPQPS